jgi:DNA-binding transcriptional ArsR family regulator
LGAAVAMVGSAEQAAAMLEPARMRLLAELASPDSAAGLARRLGMPRQRVNYHLKELERAGLVELIEERKKGNCTERLVAATARSYLIDPAVLGSLGADPARVEDRFSSAYLVALAARTIREVAELRGRAERAGKKLATISAQAEVRFASAADRAAFAEDLANAVAQLVHEYHDEAAPEGRLYRFVLGGYPATTKEEGTERVADRAGHAGTKRGSDPAGGAP